VITFGTGGPYATFLLVVVAALSARLTGRWQPGGTLQPGRKGMPVNGLAFCRLTFETCRECSVNDIGILGAGGMLLLVIGG
jgi:hypothetical protein